MEVQIQAEKKDHSFFFLLIKQIQCLITALKTESDPFIQHFKLKRDHTFDFPCFINQETNIVLVGVGVGKKNIRSRINDLYNSIGHDNVQFINIGVAGGNERRTKIGQLFLVNEISDDSSTDKYYPDILIDHVLIEGSITTVNSPIDNGGSKYDLLVDMEAHEIFSVCSKLVPLHNIAIVKLVSDHMDVHITKLDSNIISSLIKTKMDKIITFIEQFKLIGGMKSPLLSEVDMDWITKNKDKYHLTAAQVDLLTNYVKGYRINDMKRPLPVMDAEQPRSKLDQKNIFKYIREELKT